MKIDINDFFLDVYKYIELVKNGKAITISEQKQPILLIEPLEKKTKRPYGLCKGEFTVPDNFDNDLPDDIITDFEGR